MLLIWAYIQNVTMTKTPVVELTLYNNNYIVKFFSVGLDYNLDLFLQWTSCPKSYLMCLNV